MWISTYAFTWPWDERVRGPALVALEAVGMRRRAPLASGPVCVPGGVRALGRVRARACVSACACACVLYTERSLLLCLKIVLTKRKIIRPRGPLQIKDLC